MVDQPQRLCLGEPAARNAQGPTAPFVQATMLPRRPTQGIPEKTVALALEPNKILDHHAT